MKKKKVKLKSFLLVLLFIIIISLFVYGYTKLSIKNIYCIGNKLLTEQEIIEEAGLIDYPKIYLVKEKDIENKLLKNSLINKVQVSKTLLGKVTIQIEENKILYKENQNYMLSNGKMMAFNEEILGIPTLLNNISSSIMDKTITKFSLINDDTLIKISEISYAPSDLDEERFLFYMNDGNYVYVTLSKITLINSYNEILPTLDNNKGILYLDSGNHFEIKMKK